MESFNIMKSILTAIAIMASIPGQATAAAKKETLEHKVRNAPVGIAWSGPVNTYTGGSYNIGRINSYYKYAPRGPRRGIVLEAAIRYRVPWRLLLGVWVAESGAGRAWNHFGLIGPATGDLRHDAFYAARLFDRLYRSRWGHSAIR